MYRNKTIKYIIIYLLISVGVLIYTYYKLSIYV